MEKTEDPVFCRCCLAGLESTHPEELMEDMQTASLNHNNQKINVYDVYIAVSGVTLETFLEIPIADTKICLLCLENLQTLFTFRELCSSSVNKLKSLYQPATTQLPENIKDEIMSENDDYDQDDVDPHLLENDNFLEFEMKEEGEMFFDDEDDETNNEGLNSNDDGGDASTANATFSMKRLKQKFICPICQKSYRNKRSAEKHFGSQHPEAANDPEKGQIIEEPSNIKYRCEICMKICKQYSSLYDHLKRVHNSVGFSCKLCNKHFKTHTGLQLHNKAQHLNMKFPCELCPKVFNRRCNLLGHIKMEHLGVRQECKLCKKSFRTTQDLWIHSFDHRGFFPFNCQKCKYKTAQKCNFRTHLKNKHKIVYTEEEHGYRESFQDAISYVKSM